MAVCESGSSQIIFYFRSTFHERHESFQGNVHHMRRKRAFLSRARLLVGLDRADLAKTSRACSPGVSTATESQTDLVISQNS